MAQQRAPAAHYLGSSAAWGFCYGILKSAGILAAPVYGSVITTFVGIGVGVGITSATWEYFRHGNPGTIDHFIDSVHGNLPTIVMSTMPMIPILAGCCPRPNA